MVILKNVFSLIISLIVFIIYIPFWTLVRKLWPAYLAVALIQNIGLTYVVVAYHLYVICEEEVPMYFENASHLWKKTDPEEEIEKATA